MGLVPWFLGVLLAGVGFSLLLFAIVQAVRAVWRRRAGQPLEVLCVVAAPLLETVLGRAPVGGWLWCAGAAFVFGQPYVLHRLVRRFRPSPRVFDGIVAFSAVAGGVAMFVWRAVMPAFLVFVGVAAVLCLYPAMAFVREARRTAGVTRWRLGFASLGTFLFLVALVIAGVGKLSRSDTELFRETVTTLNVDSWYGLIICFSLAFNPPRWLASRWQRTEQARFLNDVASRDTEGRGRHAAADLDRAVRRSMASSRVVIALRPDHATEDLIVQLTGDTQFSGARLTPRFKTTGCVHLERIPRQSCCVIKPSW